MDDTYNTNLITILLWLAIASVSLSVVLLIVVLKSTSKEQITQNKLEEKELTELSNDELNVIINEIETIKLNRLYNDKQSKPLKTYKS